MGLVVQIKEFEGLYIVSEVVFCFIFFSNVWSLLVDEKHSQDRFSFVRVRIKMVNFYTASVR